MLDFQNYLHRTRVHDNRLIHPDLYKRLEHTYQPYSSCKKLVYLDHFVFRKMYNSVKNKNEEDKWIRRIYDILTYLVQKGKIFCPRSYLHEEETLLAIHDKDSLKKFSESLSGDITLQYPEFILLQQVILALKRYIAEGTTEKVTYSPANILVDKKEAGTWMPYFNKSNPSEGIASQLQAARDHHSDIIDRALALGREHPNKSFTNCVNFFYASQIANILRDSEDYLLKREFQFPGFPLLAKKFYNGDLSKKSLKQSNSVLLIRVILDFLIKNDKRDNISLEEKLISFFLSDQCKGIPAFSILNHLMATICIRGKNGQKKFKNQKSMMTDFEAIFTYMPYCDVMFLDNECADLLNEKNLKEYCQRYNTEIFSTKTKENIINYLERL